MLFRSLHEISVPLPSGVLNRSSLAAIRLSFIEVYEALYHSVPPGSIIEALSWRVRVSGPAPEINQRPQYVEASNKMARKGTRKIFFESGFIDAVVYDRYCLRPGDSICGPAVIEERESTTVVPPKDGVVVDDGLNLVLSVRETSQVVRRIGGGLTSADAIARIESDPIGLEIMWGRLASLIDET